MWRINKMNSTKQQNENNNVVLVGEVAGTPRCSHEFSGESFYVFDMAIQRTSGIIDTVPVMVSERLYKMEDIKVGNLYEIIGQFRSYNKRKEGKNCVILLVFAREIHELDEEEFVDENRAVILGYICKKPVYRETPLGREIADLLIAVNRAYGKSDYIHCITWGRNARYADTLEIGMRVRLQGRIQSREYVKKIGNDKTETRVTYELSVNQLALGE